MRQLYQLTLVSLFFLIGNTSFILGQNSETDTTNPPILFLFLEIEKNTNDQPTFRLNKVITSKGKLKKKSISLHAGHDPNEKGILHCSFFTHENKLLHQIDIENPLLERIEYVNEDNQFERVEISHEKKDFMIRTQGAEGLAYLIIEWEDKQERIHNSGKIFIQNN